MTNDVEGAKQHFGYELLRGHVLPMILGKHEDDILYWAGKEIARRFPLASFDELPTFFAQAGWGSLTLHKEANEKRIFRVTRQNDVTFPTSSCQLEAGFIAEQHQKLTGYLTECHGTKSDKHEYVDYEMKWDTKTIVE